MHLGKPWQMQLLLLVEMSNVEECQGVIKSFQWQHHLE
jgi:hypothetical protein